jgi:hypothetical protein
MKLRKTARYAFIGLLCVMCSVVKASAKWEAITLNDLGLFYIDPKSITEEDGRKWVWTALDYKKAQLQVEDGPGDAPDLLHRSDAHGPGRESARHVARVAEH